MKQQFPCCSQRHAIVWLFVAFLVFSSTRIGPSYLLEPIKPSSYTEGMRNAANGRDQYSHSSTDERNEERPSDTEDKTISPKQNTTLPPLDSSKFLPTTSLAGRQNCDPGPHQPMSRVNSFPNYANYSDYWADVKDYPNHLSVVCEFNSLLTSATHFPHAMQQLYGCFSYWQAYPNNKPVLLLSNKLQRTLRKNPFVGGILHAFEAQLHVEVTDKESFVQHINSSAIGPQGITVSGGYILKDAKRLNEMVRKDLSLPDDNTTSCDHAKPRIGILNRRKSVGRSIINAEIISGLSSIKSLSQNEGVHVEYFEGLDFDEQVQFFRSIDILISPHGAQLTGVALMDAPCTHLLELFPKGYAIPNFFGSLALNSGTNYCYIYLSDHSASSEQANSFSERTQARSTNICPSPDMIAGTVRELVQSWQNCCASQEDSLLTTRN